MTQIIKIKRSTVTTAPTSLQNGELAYSAVSGQPHKLFIGRPGGTTGDIDAIGGRYYTQFIDNATSLNTASTLVLRDASGNFAAGTITATSFVGPLSGNATTATTLQTARNFSITGDGTAPNVSFNGSANVQLNLTLANSGVTAGTYGSGTSIPVITVDAKGRITNVSTSTISTTLNIAGDSGTDGIALGTDTLTFEGGTGVTTTVDAVNNKVSFAIGQDVSTTSNVIFNNVTVNGTLNSDDITAATLTASGNVVVQGNLTVNGTTTSVNSTEVNIADNIIVLNSNVSGTPSTNSGIEVERGTSANVSVIWNEATDRWTFTNNGTTFNNIPISTEYDKYTSFNVVANGTSTAITSGSNVTFAGSNLSVSNVAGTITYSVANASTSVKGIASFDSNYFTVTAGAVTISNIDGGTF
jgi:hypothetical protein